MIGSGNHKAGHDWRNWLCKWQAAWLFFAKQHARAPVDAEDIVQEAILRVWRKSCHGVPLHEGQVFLEIRRLAIDRARSELRREKRELDFVATQQDLDFFEDSSDSQEVQMALNSLPPAQKEVLVLKIWADQTFESIGRILEVSPNTAASRYRYAIQALRKILNESEAK